MGSIISVPLICKTAQSKQLFDLLNEHIDNIKLITKNDNAYDNSLVVVPVYLAKSLEFDAVIVFDVSSDNYFTENDKKFLYIACTRALHSLHIYYKNKLSPLLQNIDKALYEVN